MHVLFIPLHAEIIIEARDGTEDQVEAIVKESMEGAFKRIIPEVPFVAEIRVADSWKSFRIGGNLYRGDDDLSCGKAGST
jgi:DNA polymerase I-like protein with 3'-5' exonuclease and polymerase domains